MLPSLTAFLKSENSTNKPAIPSDSQLKKRVDALKEKEITFSSSSDTYRRVHSNRGPMTGLGSVKSEKRAPVYESGYGMSEDDAERQITSAAADIKRARAGNYSTTTPSNEKPFEKMSNLLDSIKKNQSQKTLKKQKKRL
jgi:hypothetical protein